MSATPLGTPGSAHAGWSARLALVVALPVLLSRVPAMRAATELNPDESQLMAQVARLPWHPAPWTGVDGTTSGPVNTWALFLAHAAGLPLTYAAVHALAAAALAAAVALLCIALLRGAGSFAALAGAGSAALALVLAQGANFTHFSSELVPMLLESLALLGLAGSAGGARPARLASLFAALAIGVLPWAKLQTLPGAAALAWWLLLADRPDRGERGSPRGGHGRAWTVAALLLPSVGVFAVLALTRGWTDFWSSYVVRNLVYVGRTSAGLMARKALRQFDWPPSLWVAGSIGLTMLWWVMGRPGLTAIAAEHRRRLTGALAFAAASFVEVLVPRAPYPHYQLLLVPPFAALAGLVAGAWSRERAAMGAKTRSAWIVAALLAAPLATLPAALRAARATEELRAAASTTPPRRLAGAIRTFAPGAKTLAVWGWMPGLYVESGLRPGTRHAIGHFVIDPGPGRARMRATYLADMEREAPDVLVDAIGDGCFQWSWSAADRIASFPELERLVTRRYVQVAELHVAPGPEPVRIYVSRDCFSRR